MNNKNIYCIFIRKDICGNFCCFLCFFRLFNFLPWKISYVYYPNLTYLYAPTCDFCCGYVCHSSPTIISRRISSKSIILLTYRFMLQYQRKQNYVFGDDALNNWLVNLVNLGSFMPVYFNG
jgi:hypothetical protein